MVVAAVLIGNAGKSYAVWVAASRRPPTLCFYEYAGRYAGSTSLKHVPPTPECATDSRLLFFLRISPGHTTNKL